MNDARAAMLAALDDFSVPVVCTTNLARSFDPAFRRRITAAICLPMPDATQRARILGLHLPDTVPFDLPEGRTREEVLGALAADMEGLSGGDIRTVVLEAAAWALHATSGAGPLIPTHLRAAIEAVRGKAGAVGSACTVTVEEVGADGEPVGAAAHGARGAPLAARSRRSSRGRRGP